MRIETKLKKATKTRKTLEEELLIYQKELAVAEDRLLLCGRKLELLEENLAVRKKMKPELHQIYLEIESVNMLDIDQVVELAYRQLVIEAEREIRSEKLEKVLLESTIVRCSHNIAACTTTLKPLLKAEEVLAERLETETKAFVEKHKRNWEVFKLAHQAVEQQNQEKEEA
jgi:hypothetical protein